jgi:NTE family protein
VVFDCGEIVPAVMASMSIPGVFPPYRIGEELYVDGGVLEPLPVPTLIERGATAIYALDCSDFPLGLPIRGSLVDRCARIAAYAAARQVTSLSATRGRTVHLLRPELAETPDFRSFDRTAELIRMGYEYTRRYLEERGLIASEDPSSGTSRPQAVPERAR